MVLLQRDYNPGAGGPVDRLAPTCKKKFANIFAKGLANGIEETRKKTAFTARITGR